MPHHPYTKPSKTPADLVAHLEARGLIVSDRARAERAIAEIGYQRLKIYFLSRRQQHVVGKPFEASVSFDDIITIYKFDEELRMLCFKECGRVEVIFRGVISETLSTVYGPHPYFDDHAFAKDRRIEGLRCLSEVFYKNLPSDPRAKHYFSSYNPPMLPPIWVIKDLMTFGTANHFFSTLSKINRDAVASRINTINSEILQSWIKAFIDLRNVCAHHDRLFNRSFQKQPIRIKKLGVPTATVPNRLLSLLECMPQ